MSIASAFELLLDTPREALSEAILAVRERVQRGEPLRDAMDRVAFPGWLEHGEVTDHQVRLHADMQVVIGLSRPGALEDTEPRWWDWSHHAPTPEVLQTLAAAARRVLQ